MYDYKYSGDVGTYDAYTARKMLAARGGGAPPPAARSSSAGPVRRFKTAKWNLTFH